jgi:hypothetical protein
VPELCDSLDSIPGPVRKQSGNRFNVESAQSGGSSELDIGHDTYSRASFHGKMYDVASRRHGVVNVFVYNNSNLNQIPRYDTNSEELEGLLIKVNPTQHYRHRLYAIVTDWSGH